MNECQRYRDFGSRHLKVCRVDKEMFESDSRVEKYSSPCMGKKKQKKLN